jgi:hypothetical protein
VREFHWRYLPNVAPLWSCCCWNDGGNPEDYSAEAALARGELSKTAVVRLEIAPHSKTSFAAKPDVLDKSAKQPISLETTTFEYYYRRR